MKKLLLMSMVSLSILLSIGCEKDLCLTGTARFTNTSNNPYELWIDGEFQRQVSGNTFVEFDLLEGNHTIYVKQISGFLLFPTERTGNISVFGCQEVEWIFP